MAGNIGRLREIMLEDGDLDLFPEVVVRLYDKGRRTAARSDLVRLAAREPDQARRKRQLEHAADMTLWVTPLRSPPRPVAIFGFGTALRPALAHPGGLHTVVLWLTALFVPVFPVSSFLAREERAGWNILGRAPMPNQAYGPVWLLASIPVGALALTVAGVMWHDARHITIVAHNGFGEAVVVAVNGAEHQTVEAHGQATFPGVPADAVRLEAFREDGHLIEALDEDLTGHAWDEAVYNVAARGVLMVDYVRYGRGEASESRILPPEPIQFFDTSDYLFVEPPERKEVAKGSFIENAVISAMDPDLAVQAAMLESMLPAHLLPMIRAERALHPEHSSLGLLEARVRSDVDPADAAAFVSAWRLEAPDLVDAHRAFQDHGGIAREALIAEYDARLAASPDDPDAMYLAARARADDDPQGLRLLNAAVERAPDHGRSLQTLANRAARLGDYPDAARHLDRLDAIGALDDDQRVDRIRLARVLGNPVPDVDENTWFADLLQIEGDPGTVDSAVARVVARDPTLDPAIAMQLEAELRLAAGDFERVRALISQHDEGMPKISVRLALSDGATSADRDDALARRGTAVEAGLEPALLWALEERAGTAPAWRVADVALIPVLAEVAAPGVREDPASVDARIRGHVSLLERGALYAALALVLGEGPGAAEYRRRARALLLPAEGPWYAP